MKIFNRLYTFLVFLFLYAPIIVLLLFSFNSSSSTSVFSGFSTQWYKLILHDSTAITALRNTLILAVLSAVIATIIGTAAAVYIYHIRNKLWKNSLQVVTNIPMTNPDIVTGVSLMLQFPELLHAAHSTHTFQPTVCDTERAAEA